MLTNVLHNRSNEFTMLNLGEQHLRNGLFVKNAILFALHRQTDVYTTTLGRRDLCVQAVFTEEDLPRIS